MASNPAHPKAVHHQVVIVGGGNAGLSVAARLQRAGLSDIAVVEPSEVHSYQPLWTLVGGGRANAATSQRSQASVMPRGIAWIKDRAEAVDPEEHTVLTAGGLTLSYEQVVVCPGIQLDWGRVPGMADALSTASVSSNYRLDLAEKTWRNIDSMTSGRAVFTMPSGPIKCAGAPQKIAYLAADHWRRKGVLDNIDITLVLPTPGMFGVKEFADELERVVAHYGISVEFNSEMVEVDPDTRTAIIANNAEGTKHDLTYDLLHTVPPQSAPDWIKSSPLADLDNPAGYVQVGKHSMQHARFPDVFALGDAGSTPNSKTGAAIRKQAPVLVENLLAVRADRAPSAQYDGYASCPLTTARNKMLLAEFDYSMKPAPSIPVIDTTHERRDMWLLKKYGLPFLYWNFILTGRA